MATNDSIDSANIPPPLSHGGTGANLTASNGGILYSDATKAQILAATSTGNQPLLSGASGAPGWSTATYPGATTANQLLYSSANNTIAGLTSGNDGILITSGAGVPSISSTPPTAVLNNIPGRLKSFQILTTGTAATYTTPAAITAILVECIGGGGAGGGTDVTSAVTFAAAAGGGGGGYCRKWITGAAATYTYTIGAGGTPGAAGANPGGNGAATTFSGSSLSAAGGTGGGGAAAQTAPALGGTGAVGGAGTNGDLNITGSPGLNGVDFINGAYSGGGGNSYLGAGALGIPNTSAGTAASANTGGGGSGAAGFNNAALQGGAGGSGLIIVWEFS